MFGPTYVILTEFDLKNKKELYLFPAYLSPRHCALYIISIWVNMWGGHYTVPITQMSK